METKTLLGGRLLWSAHAHNPPEDGLWLAAAVPTLPKGAHVLDIGCGAGLVALALGTRVPHVILQGVEIDAQTAQLARENASLNRIPLGVHHADITTWHPPHMYQAVLSNPPFHAQARGHTSPNATRNRSHSMPEGLLTQWLDTAATCLAPGGRVYLVVHAACRPELDGYAHTRGGGWQWAPLATHAVRPAKRLLVCWQPQAERQSLALPHVCAFHPEVRHQVLHEGRGLDVFTEGPHPR